jgi:hypothetical protein
MNPKKLKFINSYLFLILKNKAHAWCQKDQVFSYSNRYAWIGHVGECKNNSEFRKIFSGPQIKIH